MSPALPTAFTSRSGGGQGPTLRSAAVAPAALVAPEPMHAVDAADVPRIEREAARARAELARTALALRAARAAAVAARDRVDALGPDDDLGEAPTAFLEVVDARLSATAAGLDASVRSARSEAEIMVAAAHHRADELRARAGLPRPGSTGPGGVTVAAPEVRPIARPRSATELWAGVRSARARGLTVGALGAPGGRATTDDGPDPLGSEGAAGDAAQVFELFWDRVPSERPLRDRLRRRSQRAEVRRRDEERHEDGSES